MDPLVLTLRALQASANNKHVEAPMTWDAINHIGEKYGSPDIDYDRFAKRWEEDPMMKQLVARFDGHGLVIKTDKHEPKPEQGTPAKSMKASAAMSAVKRTDKA